MIEEIDNLEVNTLLENLDEDIALQVEMGRLHVYIEPIKKELKAQRRDIILYTEGVGPCIAFLASGQYRYEDDEEQAEYYFAALYHYSGGNQAELKEEELLEVGKDNLRYFFDDIHERIGEDAIMTVHQLCFIGGQKADKDCCGTEKEVWALKAVFEQEDPYNEILGNNMDMTSSLQPEFCFFPTHGEAFVDIYMQRDGDAGMKVNYVTIDNNPPFLDTVKQNSIVESKIKEDLASEEENSVQQSAGMSRKNREYKKETVIEGCGRAAENRDEDKIQNRGISTPAAFFHFENVAELADAGQKRQASCLDYALPEKRFRKTNLDLDANGNSNTKIYNSSVPR